MVSAEVHVPNFVLAEAHSRLHGIDGTTEFPVQLTDWNQYFITVTADSSVEAHAHLEHKGVTYVLGTRVLIPTT